MLSNLGHPRSFMGRLGKRARGMYMSSDDLYVSTVFLDNKSNP